MIKRVAPALLLVACTASPAAPPPKPLVDASVPEAPARTLEQACNDVAFAYCKDFSTCISHVAIQFADSAKCVAGMRARCVRDGSAPGVGDVVANVDRCARRGLDVACERRQWELRRCLGSPATIRGALPDGAPCWLHTQCASGMCDGSFAPLTLPCGTCKPAPNVGDVCEGTSCNTTNVAAADTNLRCDEATKRCVVGDGEGMSCETSPPDGTCDRNLECLDGRCAIPPLGATIRSLGEDCGRPADGYEFPARVCRGGMWCGPERVCIPTAALGEKCSRSELGECGWDAVCAKAAGGTTCQPIEDVCR